MNSNVKHSIIRMEEDELRNLVTEVKETVALDVDMKQSKAERTFGQIDLWKIQKSMRRATRLSEKLRFDH